MKVLPDIQESYKQIWQISMGPVTAEPTEGCPDQNRLISHEKHHETLPQFG